MEVFLRLLKLKSENGYGAVAIPEIYMKLSFEVVNKKGKTIKKYKFVPIAAAAV